MAAKAERTIRSTEGDRGSSAAVLVCKATRRTPALLVALLIATALTFCAEAPSPGDHRDDLGRTVQISAKPSRIITLAPNVTEMVFAIGEGSALVGADDASNHPPAAGVLPKVGAMQPNIEKIVELQPDLVLASTEGNHPNLAGALAAAGVPLYVVRTDRLDEIAAAMRRLGRVLEAPGAEPAARKLERDIAEERRTRSRPPRVMFVVWTDPLYVAGRETFTDDLLELTGAANAVEVKGWPQYSLESVVKLPPDLVLYPRGAMTEGQMAAFLGRLPLPHPEVVAVDEDVFQRPGPRVDEAARRLNAILDARR
ncbi:MAG TPA: helical backbone metal receptor [Thermoanaerobaculia bacterium]